MKLLVHPSLWEVGRGEGTMPRATGTPAISLLVSATWLWTPWSVDVMWLLLVRTRTEEEHAPHWIPAFSASLSHSLNDCASSQFWTHCLMHLTAWRVGAWGSNIILWGPAKPRPNPGTHRPHLNTWGLLFREATGSSQTCVFSNLLKM